MPMQVLHSVCKLANLQEEEGQAAYNVRPIEKEEVKELKGKRKRKRK